MFKKKLYQEKIIYTVSAIAIVVIVLFSFKTGDTKAQKMMDDIQLMSTQEFLNSKSLKGVNVNYQNGLGYSLLHFAVEKGNVSFVIELLSKGANPNLKNKASYTPLHLASMYGMVLILDRLLKKGADPNIKDDSSKTPLFYASERGSMITAQKLIEHGANLSYLDHKQETVLDKAMLYGYPAMARLFMRWSYEFYEQFVSQKLKYFSYFYRDQQNVTQMMINRLDLLSLNYRVKKNCLLCEKQNNLLDIPYIGSEYLFRWLE